MSKYGKYTGGQIEAALNMIGGETVIDGLLAGTIEVVAKSVTATKIPEEKFVVCAASGNRCTIDGSYFADGDDICQHGHQIGQQYAVVV